MNRHWIWILGCVLSLGCEGPEGEMGVTGLDGEEGVDGQDGQDGVDALSHVYIDADIRWDEDLTLMGTVVVRQGATLTVAAGTQIDLGPGSHLVVDGSFVSEGSAEAPVVMSTLGDWFSLVTLTGSGTFQYVSTRHVHVTVLGDGFSRIADCTFSNSEVWVEQRTADLNIRDSSFEFEPLWRENNLVLLDVSGAVTVENTSFTGGFYGISWSSPADTSSLLVNNSVFDNHYSGIQAGLGVVTSSAALTVVDSTFTDLNLAGVELRSGSAALSNVVVTDSDAYGVRAYPETEVTLSNVEVSATGGTCVSLSGPKVTVNGLTLEGCGARGVDISAGELIGENIVVDGAESDALYVKALTLSNSTLSNNAGSGIYVTGSEISTVTHSVVSGNGEYGIRGPSSGTNLLDVLGNNLTNNGQQAANEVRLMSGNYVADNDGETGVDEGTGGDLDGVRNTDTAQINDADQIEDPLSEPITGAGAVQ